MKLLRVLVADDEAPARRRLEELVGRTPGAELAAVVSSGGEALAVIRRVNPDVALLDIRMPGLEGVEVARLLEEDGPPEVVFVTAYGEHAMDAFDVGACDYLLKPFDDARFRQAMDRCRARIRRRRVEAAGAEIGALLQEVDTKDTGPAEGPGTVPPGAESGERGPVGSFRELRRLALDHRGRKVLIDLDEVSRIQADGSYVRIHAGSHAYLLRERLKRLAERLPARDFCRVHRSYIVRLDRIESLEERGRGDLTAHLAGGTQVPVSRTFRQELERRLGTL